jgi:beta-aspartyl-peptidase (threonine type)
MILTSSLYKIYFFTLIINAVTLNVETEKTIKSNPVIVIHGGAGNISKEEMTPQIEKEYRKVIEMALRQGYFILAKGGSNLLAIETSLKIMENSRLFNAGKGSVLNYEGNIEMDAAIMDGKNLEAGAIAGVSHVKNPISAALKVMEKSGHVMLIKEGAEIFAKEQGLELVDSSYFIPYKNFNELKNKKSGTVGALALDAYGNIAAGTSTGGISNKKYGRVGDSPIIGAGTYANNSTCAVSCTGVGEYFMRCVAAYDVSALMEYKKFTVQEAAEYVINNRISKLNGKGGLIAIDREGNVAMPFNTKAMFRGVMNKEGWKILIFE